MSRNVMSEPFASNGVRKCNVSRFAQPAVSSLLGRFAASWISSIVTSFIMAVSCSVIFDFAAMLDVERSARGGYVLAVVIITWARRRAVRGVRCASGETNAASRVAQAARERAAC
jgi:hypothetical protein